jgi:hypothetical protein
MRDIREALGPEQLVFAMFSQATGVPMGFNRGTLRSGG